MHPWLLVAPLAGAWIETYTSEDMKQWPGCRTPRGCVD